MPLNFLKISFIFSVLYLLSLDTLGQEFKGNFTREYVQDGQLKCAHYIVKEDGYGCITMVLDDHDREKGVSVTCKRDTMGNRKIYINTYHEQKVIIYPTSYDKNGNIRQFEIMYEKRDVEVYTK
ncbi:MAG: hypothetical protein RIF46_04490 [Cyclobacteriaceae bacterium]